MSAKDNMFDPANVRPKTSDVIGKERHYYSYPGESEYCSACCLLFHARERGGYGVVIER